MTITLRKPRPITFASDANPASINRDVMPERRCAGWRNAHLCATLLSRYNTDTICSSCSHLRAIQITVDAQKHSTKLLRCNTCELHLPDEDFAPRLPRVARRGRESVCRQCENARRQAARMAGSRLQLALDDVDRTHGVPGGGGEK